MKKVLFDQIFTVMKDIGIKPMLGTKTNIKRLPNVKHFGNFEVDGKKMEMMINIDGPEKVLKMFQSESGYIPQMSDQEGRMFLKNINTLRPLINPPENVIPGPGSLDHTLNSPKVKAQMKESRAIWKEMGADPTSNQGARKYLDLSKEMDAQGLNSDSLEDVIKFMKGKRAATKIIEDEQGVGSLFKENTDTRIVDVVDDLKKIEDEAGSLESSMQSLKNLAFKLTPEYEAQKKAAHQAWFKRAYEGKGFDGREGYFRAVVRPFLIDQHKKGIIKIPDDHLTSLKESNDLKSGGGAEELYPDPVRMFRHYYGEEAFDKIPDNIESPATSSILEAFAKDINTFKPIKTVGPETGMGYQTKGELLARIEERQKLINDIRRGDEWPITEWTKDHKLETIANSRLQIDTYRQILDKYYPGSSTYPKSTKLWDLVDETTGKIDDDFDPDIGGMAQGGRVGLVKGSGKKGIEFLIKKLNKKLGKDTIKKASDLPKGTKYEELEAIKAFEERNPMVNIWEDPVKLRAAVDDIFPSGDYKYDAEMAAEALVENNPQVFGNKLYEDLDQATQLKIYGGVLGVVQSDLGKMLQMKRLSKPTKTLEGIQKTGTIDISDPNVADEFSRFMKETDPKGHKKIEEIVELSNFDPKGRKKNTTGGGVGSMFREV
jgi:hypothetical protein